MGLEDQHTFSILFDHPSETNKLLQGIQKPLILVITTMLAAVLWGVYRSLSHANSLHQKHQQLAREVERRASAEQRLRELANTDELTDLPNRRSFNTWLKHKTVENQRYNIGLALLFIDLDGFKSVNDRLGHKAGDELLKLVAQRLSVKFRQADIVARLGGDEFCVIITGSSEPSVLKPMLSGTIKLIEEVYPLANSEARISCSIGIAIHEPKSETDESLICRADNAMYQAKEQGKGRYVFAAT